MDRRLSGDARQTGDPPRSRGFYSPLLEWLTARIDDGFVSRRAMDRLLVTDSVVAALALATGR